MRGHLRDSAHLAHILCILFYHDPPKVGGCVGRHGWLVCWHCTSSTSPHNSLVVTVDHEVLTLA